MDKSSKYKPGIVINEISIRNLSSHWVSIFVRKAIGTMCLNALLVLHKILFENLDKTKNFNNLKFSLCLNEKNLQYGHFDFRAWFQIQMDTLLSTRQLLIGHKNDICACAFAKFGE